MNGTYSEETCENGLVYGEGHGAAHNFCNYNWEVDCGTRAYDDTPISSPGIGQPKEQIKVQHFDHKNLKDFFSEAELF